jgi:hypothetical protein
VDDSVNTITWLWSYWERISLNFDEGNLLESTNWYTQSNLSKRTRNYSQLFCFQKQKYPRTICIYGSIGKRVPIYLFFFLNYLFQIHVSDNSKIGDWNVESDSIHTRVRIYSSRCQTGIVPIFIEIDHLILICFAFFCGKVKFCNRITSPKKQFVHYWFWFSSTLDDNKRRTSTGFSLSLFAFVYSIASDISH